MKNYILVKIYKTKKIESYSSEINEIPKLDNDDAQLL